MSDLGHSRRFGHVGDISGLPPDSGLIVSSLLRLGVGACHFWLWKTQYFGLAQLIVRKEPTFYAVNSEKIGDRHERERAHEGGVHWDETEPVGKRRVGKRHRYAEGEQRTCHERAREWFGLRSIRMSGSIWRRKRSPCRTTMPRSRRKPRI